MDPFSRYRLKYALRSSQRHRLGSDCVPRLRMMTKQVLVGFGIDVDAAAGWIDKQDGSKVDTVKISRGVFGAMVGVDRLLNLCSKFNIKASWFVPAHTCETFPAQIAKIRDSGHEIGLHGYTHEEVSALSESQEATVLRRSINVLTSFLGRKPEGWTAPAWTCSASTVHLLQAEGIIYDHSFMHHDCQMYYLPFSNYDALPTDYTAPAETWMRPMNLPRVSSVVNVPANWHLDDWPAFSPGDGGSDGFIDPDIVLKMWKVHFRYCYENYDQCVVPVSLHPQISGRPHVLEMLAEFVEWTRGFEGVEWCTFAEMAARFKSTGFAKWDGMQQ